MSHIVSLKIGGETLILETGKMAKQANGAVFARYGGTAVLATVCCSAEPSDKYDYIPLSVDYNEKYYAAGKIPGGFLKRETRPKDKEILVSRLIDRPMRPLFSKNFGREIQIIPTTVSTDQINPPDVIAMVAASAAVFISDIPFDGPVAAVRVCSLKGELFVNPTYEQVEQSELDIIVSGTEDNITMVEGGALEVSEELMLRAIETAHPAIRELCRIQRELQALAGKAKLPLVEKPAKVDAVIEEIRASVRNDLVKACFVKGKMERYAAIRDVLSHCNAHFAERITDENRKAVAALYEDMEYEILRTSILNDKLRVDGRRPDEIRQITCEIDILPRTHGSALFTRGETQALVVSTLGTVFDEQIIDNIEGDSRDRFLLHYNFPPFSVGETGRLATGRREIGHGHLALRAIEGVLPTKENFPYTIRLVSEVLESNGSSSMATVCGSTLALMSAGVPISKPVAGIAMGLISDGSRFEVLSDILGEEDHLGDMDFKVAGTVQGITGFQMDVKIAGVSRAILEKALEQARVGRLKILDIMKLSIEQPRSDISEYAPKIVKLKINPEKIGAVIGPGGKMIKSITERTEANIDIGQDGTIVIYCRKQEGANAALAIIQGIVEEPEIGRIYQGTVRRIMDFGAFVEFLPGREGLVHISKLSKERVEKVDDVLHLGDAIPVKLVEIDRMGRLNLSYIEAIDPTYVPPPHSAERPERRDRDDRGPRRDRDDRGPRRDHR